MTKFERMPPWSSDERALFEALSESDPAWDKVRQCSELFGVDSNGMALVRYLHDRGYRVGSPVPDRHGFSVSQVWTEGFTMELAFGPQPRVLLRVGEWQDNLAARRALALADVIGHDRYVRVSRDKLSVVVGVPHPLAGRDLLKVLDTAAASVRTCLDDLENGTGAGHDALVECFVKAGLAVPRLPTPLGRDLRVQDAWHWSTRSEPPETLLRDYLLATQEELLSAVENHTTISYSGHGIDSHAWTWRVAFGPLAAMVQDHWRGAEPDPADNGRLAELFERLGQLLDLAQERMAQVTDPPTGSWVRPVHLVVSSMHQPTGLRIWDPLRGRRVVIETQDIWSDAADFLRRSDIPPAGAGVSSGRSSHA